MLAAAGITGAGCDAEESVSNPAGHPVNGNPPTTEQPSGSLTLNGRTVGVVATEPNGGDFGQDVIQRIINTGATSTSLSVYWDPIEQSAGVYLPEPNYLAIAEIFYPPFGILITHSFSVIDTTNKRLPLDLADRPFDDPEVIGRFNAMLNWAATQMPSVNLHVISIGNEVDVYLNAHPDDVSPHVVPPRRLLARIIHENAEFSLVPCTCRKFRSVGNTVYLSKNSNAAKTVLAGRPRRTLFA